MNRLNWQELLNLRIRLKAKVKNYHKVRRNHRHGRKKANNYET